VITGVPEPGSHGKLSTFYTGHTGEKKRDWLDAQRRFVGEELAVGIKYQKVKEILEALPGKEENYNGGKQG